MNTAKHIREHLDAARFQITDRDNSQDQDGLISLVGPAEPPNHEMSAQQKAGGRCARETTVWEQSSAEECAAHVIVASPVRTTLLRVLVFRSVVVRNLLDVEVSGEGPDLLDGAATPLAPTGASAFEELEALEDPEPDRPVKNIVELKTRQVDGFARPPPMPPWSHLRARFVKRHLEGQSSGVQ